jgi:hypothetical protein
MDNVTLALIICAAIVLALIIRFRREVSVSIEALGIAFKAKGKANSEQSSGHKSKELQTARGGNVTAATGDRSAAVGGDAKDATIITGDNNRTGP